MRPTLLVLQNPVVAALSRPGPTNASRGPGRDNAADAATTVVSTVTDGTVEAVTFDGQPAAWIDGRVLKWEAGGWAFDVGGLGLDLETATAIGRSLR